MNRKGMPTVLKTRIPNGYQRGNVSVIQSNDTKEVHLLSTIHSLENVIV